MPVPGKQSMSWHSSRAVLRERLAEAAGQADLPGDQTACRDAASAAGRICQLMTR